MKFPNRSTGLVSFSLENPVEKIATRSKVVVGPVSRGGSSNLLFSVIQNDVSTNYICLAINGKISPKVRYPGKLPNTVEIILSSTDSAYRNKPMESFNPILVEAKENTF